MSRKSRLLLALLAVAVTVPVAWYDLWLGRAPAATTTAARRLVNEQSAVLVNIGVAPELAMYFRDGVEWLETPITAARSKNDVPQPLRGKKLLLLCTAGIRSAQAAVHLQQIGVDAASVRGGAQQFLCAVPGCSAGVLFGKDSRPDTDIPAFRKSPVHEQWAAVVAFFGIKAVYSLLSLLIVVALWKRKEQDLSAVRWSMIFFFVGEACCFFNVMVFFEDSVLLEHLHSVGMVLSMGFFAYSSLEGLDARLVHFSNDARCLMMGLCRGCDKHGKVGCALRKLFLLSIPAAALLAAMPLCAGFCNVAYNTRILGVLHSYRHPVVHQLYELRYLPVLAMTLLASCFLVLWRVERRPVVYAKILFSAALGAMGFSLLRLALVAPFGENQVWFDFWEEATELLYIGMVGAVLLFFQRGLLADPQPVKEEVAA